MTSAVTSDYRLAPLVVARMVGLYLVLFAVVLLACTVAVAAADLPADLMVVVLLLGLMGLVLLAWLLRSRLYVVRFGPQGYRVRFVRGVGRAEASWREVAEVLTSAPAGAPCVVIRLRDGSTSTIPVQALAVDREQFVRDLRACLDAGQGLRPLEDPGGPPGPGPGDS